MKVSQLKPYSIGIVAENKPLNSKMVDVVPSEDVPFVNGELNSDTKNDTVDSSDQAGSSYQVSLTSANVVKAEWLPMGGSNRVTAPDVRRGETVVLYRFADVDKFYWITLKDDMNLRKLETVIYAFSATQDESSTEVGPDTYYYLEVSTHRKLIHFHTTKANKEPFGYDIQINTAEGFIKFQDDAGNFIILDSKEKQIAAKNTDGSYIDLNKKNLTISVPETVKIISKDLIHEIAETITTGAGKSITENTKDHTTNASGALKEQAGSIDVNSSSTLNETASGTIMINGNGVTITKGVKLLG